METVELITYIGVAVLVGGLIVMVTWKTDFGEHYRRTWDAYDPKEEAQYQVDAAGFGEQLVKRWEECRYGLDNTSTSVYVADEAIIDRSVVVQQLLKINACNVVDCKNASRLVVHDAIETPKVININCYNETLIIS